MVGGCWEGGSELVHQEGGCVGGGIDQEGVLVVARREVCWRWQ